MQILTKPKDSLRCARAMGVKSCRQLYDDSFPRDFIYIPKA